MFLHYNHRPAVECVTAARLGRRVRRRSLRACWWLSCAAVWADSGGAAVCTAPSCCPPANRRPVSGRATPSGTSRSHCRRRRHAAAGIAATLTPPSKRTARRTSAKVACDNAEVSDCRGREGLIFVECYAILHVPRTWRCRETPLL